jgi:PmbA protein
MPIVKGEQNMASQKAASKKNTKDVFNTLNNIVKQAKKLGATDVEVSHVQSASLSASVRLGKVESLEYPVENTIHIGAYVGQKYADTTVNSLRPEHLKMAIKNVVESAKISTDNPFAGLADPSQISKKYPEVENNDPVDPDMNDLINSAIAAEKAALAVPGISETEGAGASWGRTSCTIVASNGFSESYSSSYHSLYTGVIAKGKDGNKASSYGQTVSVFKSDLKSAKEVGEEAAKKTLAKIDAAKIKASSMPVVFAPQTASGLVRAFAGAVSGGSIAKGTSFLKDAMGKKLFKDNVTIVDDPLLKRGLGSRSFDGNGIESRKLIMVDKGELKSWLMGLESSRQLGLQTTGHAGGTSNLYMEAGDVTPDELIKDIKEGVYITGLMGAGSNTVNGNYSTAAYGILIKDGKITDQAVNDFTLGGKLLDMYASMTPANDLDKLRSSVSAPTLRIDGMTVA